MCHSPCMRSLIVAGIPENMPSQNPPSNINPHILVTTGFLLAGIHITKARVVSNKVKRSYTTFCVRHHKCYRLCHTFQINAAVMTSLETARTILFLKIPNIPLRKAVFAETLHPRNSHISRSHIIAPM